MSEQFLMFRDLPVGAMFTWLGKTFTKIAPEMAWDEKRRGHIFGVGGTHPVQLVEGGEVPAFEYAGENYGEKTRVKVRRSWARAVAVKPVQDSGK